MSVVGAIDAKRILKARNLVAARARDRPRHGASARREESPHGDEHGDELPGLRTRVRGTRSAVVLLQFAARLRAKNAAASAKSGTRNCKPERERPANRCSRTSSRPSGNWNGSRKTKRVPCPECHGSRLNPVARHVRLQGQTIDNFTALLGGRSAGTDRQAAFPRHAKNDRGRSRSGDSSSGFASWRTSGSVISRSGVRRKR